MITNLIVYYIAIAILMAMIVYFDLDREQNKHIKNRKTIAMLCGIIWPVTLIYLILN